MGCKCSKRLARYVSTPKKAPKRVDPASKPVVSQTIVALHADAENIDIEVTENDKPTEQAIEEPPAKRLYSVRRAEEAHVIKTYDSAEADVYYLIDLNWLSEWRSFAFEDGPIPGPIDNGRLVDTHTGMPKSGLQLKDDYRGVNSKLWNFWHGRYGGGPEVPRNSLDLYSPAPSPFVTVEEPKAAPKKKKAAEPKDRFPLRLGFASPPPAVYASKGLAGFFDTTASANESLCTSELPVNIVLVNIYDLGSDDLGKTINQITTMNDSLMVGGVFHAGIEVYGYEWSFARIEDECSGVWRTMPRMEMGHKYRGTMPLGSTKLSQAQVWTLMHRLGKEWPSAEYDLLRRNCLSFCNALCEELGVRSIPGWVDRAPRAASAVLNTTNMLGCTGRDK